MVAKIEVSYYGVHWDQDKVAWLEQGRGGVNVYGLKERSPFLVHFPQGGRHCNHQVNLATPIPNDRHWEIFLSLQTDPLVRAMMPFPKADAGLYYLEHHDALTNYLHMLSRMSSPILPSVLPFYSFQDLAGLLRALGETNVQPLVLFGAQLADIKTIREIVPAAQHRPRKLVMTGTRDIVLPTGVRKITTELTGPKYDFNELQTLPWEALGAHALKKWMRREWADEKTTNPKSERSNRPTDPARDKPERVGG